MSMKWIRKIPFPTCGLMLAVLSLGNLLRTEYPSIYAICGVTGVILGAGWILRIFAQPETWIKEMKNPVLASTGGTFSMGLMLLAGYVQNLFGRFGIYLWYIGLFLHICLIIWFSLHFLHPVCLSQVYASYFVVYVGIGAATISASDIKITAESIPFCYFAMIAFFPLFLLISYRYWKLGEPESIAEKSLFCIYGAPASLCLTAYLSSALQIQKDLIIVLLIFSIGCYLMVLFKIPGYLFMPWTASQAAMTFPCVISAVAMKKTIAYLDLTGLPEDILQAFNAFQIIFGTVLLLYILIRFCIEWIGNPSGNSRGDKI